MDTVLTLMIVLNNPTIVTNAKCISTAGSYLCLCNLGWTVTFDAGQTCQEYNECDDILANDCHVKATCSNNDGSLRVHVTLVLKMPKTNLLVMQKTLLMYPTT